MKVFLCYASEQRDTVEAVQLGLLGAGHEVFFDREALAGGANYLTGIASEIQACDAFVFFVSPEAVAAGRYTLSELDLARRKWPHPQGHVIPVLAAPTPFASMPAYLKAVTVLEPRGNLAADVVHAVQFDLPGSTASARRAARQGPLSTGLLATLWAIALPVLIFGTTLVLVRLDVIQAERLNYAAPLGGIAAAVAVLWILVRRPRR